MWMLATCYAFLIYAEYKSKNYDKTASDGFRACFFFWFLGDLVKKCYIDKFNKINTVLSNSQLTITLKTVDNDLPTK